MPALGRVDKDRVGVHSLAEERLDAAVPQHLLEDRPVGRAQDQPVGRVLLDRQSPVAGHRLGDVDEKALRHGIPAVSQERVDDLLGIVAGGTSVPEPERGDAIGVDVFRSALKFGERSDVAARGLGSLVVDLQQEGFVALDDERPAGHRFRLPSHQRNHTNTNRPMTALIAKVIQPRVAVRAARSGSLLFRASDMTAMTPLGGPMMPVAMIAMIEMMSRTAADTLLGATVVAVGAG